MAGELYAVKGYDTGFRICCLNDEARRLLETTDHPIDRIAADCGFGSATTFRQNFAEAFRTTPSDYRRRFDASA